MKKICTSSSCRKSFSYHPEYPVKCPHCGKNYPRIGVRPKPDRRYICIVDEKAYDLTDFVKDWKMGGMKGASKLIRVRALRKMSGLDMSGANLIVDNMMEGFFVNAFRTCDFVVKSRDYLYR